MTLVGPNGAGKSTFLKAIVGMIPAMDGRVVLEGEDVTNMRADHLAKRGVGYVPQVNDVFDTLTVVRTASRWAVICCRPPRSVRVRAVLAIFPALKAVLREERPARRAERRGKMLAMAARVLMLSSRDCLCLTPEPWQSNLSDCLYRGCCWRITFSVSAIPA